MYSDMFTARSTQLHDLLKNWDWKQRPLVFSVPGSGLSARSAVQEGVPFLMVLNSGVYRSMGVVSQACFMPFGNANDQVEQLIDRQILPICPDTPLVAGVFAADDTVSLKERFARLKKLGGGGRHQLASGQHEYRGLYGAHAAQRLLGRVRGGNAEGCA